MSVGDRHELPRSAEQVARDAEMEQRILDDLLADPVRKAFAIGVAVQGAQNLFGCQVVAGAAAEQLWATARIGAQLGRIVFARVVSDEPVSLPLGDRDCTFEPTSPSPEAGPAQWAQAYYFALLAGDHSAAESLAEVPLELLREAGEPDPTVMHRATALQIFAAGDAFEPPAFEGALGAVVTAEVAAAAAIADADSTALNDALESGVAAQRQLVEATRAHSDPALWYAHGMLALAVEARRRDLQVAFESDYLPLERL